MKNKLIIIIVFVGMLTDIGLGQISIDSSEIKKNYTNIDEALKNPEKVYRLDLSNQNVNIPNEVWLKFINLEFLSFRNDHLKEIPNEIGLLKNLKILDLSGNDFKELPKSLSGLFNLEELFLNDETNFKLKKSIDVISLLPELRILHLENDRLKKLPKNIWKLRHLETLYLKNNNFREIPIQLKSLNQLKYLDLQHNKIKLDTQDMSIRNFGYQIKF